MSAYDYKESLRIAKLDPPFYATIMAAMRKADDTNLARLLAAWPEVWAELQARYNVPGGVLPEEQAALEAERLADYRNQEAAEEACDPNEGDR